MASLLKKNTQLFTGISLFAIREISGIICVGRIAQLVAFANQIVRKHCSNNICLLTSLPPDRALDVVQHVSNALHSMFANEKIVVKPVAVCCGIVLNLILDQKDKLDTK